MQHFAHMLITLMDHLHLVVEELISCVWQAVVPNHCVNKLFLNNYFIVPDCGGPSPLWSLTTTELNVSPWISGCHINDLPELLNPQVDSVSASACLRASSSESQTQLCAVNLFRIQL